MNDYLVSRLHTDQHITLAMLPHGVLLVCIVHDSYMIRLIQRMFGGKRRPKPPSKGPPLTRTAKLPPQQRSKGTPAAAPLLTPAGNHFGHPVAVTPSEVADIVEYGIEPGTKPGSLVTTGRDIPSVLVTLWKHLEQCGGMETVGIFRVAPEKGALDQAKRVLDKADAGKTHPILVAEVRSHTITLDLAYTPTHAHTRTRDTHPHSHLVHTRVSLCR